MIQMLVGVVAFNVLKVMDADDDRALGVLLVGYFFQGVLQPSDSYVCLCALTSDVYSFESGLGFFMTFFYICIYIIRIIMVSIIFRNHQECLPYLLSRPAS